MSSRCVLFATLLTCLCILAAGCGSGDDESQPAAPAPARPEDFPKPAGKSLADLSAQLREGGPVLAPSVSQLVQGKNRFGFGLFDRERAQIADAQVVVYVAPVGGGRATGPYPARYESLAVKPQYQSRQVAADPDAAKSVYVAQIPFPKPGKYDILGIARLDDRLVAATPAGPPVTVVKRSDDAIPEPGDQAPMIHTPTETDARGDIASIDTRIPPDSMHKVDFADVVGKKPIVLIFATPQLCQSRVCGPVVDIVEEVKAEHDWNADFIHMEVYRDNSIAKGLRPQLVAWNLQTEPWLFTVDRQGKVAARMEGAFSAPELEAAIKKAGG